MHACIHSIPVQLNQVTLCGLQLYKDMDILIWLQKHSVEDTSFLIINLTFPLLTHN